VEIKFPISSPIRVFSNKFTRKERIALKLKLTMSVRTDRNTPSEASTVDTAVISDVASFALNGGAMDHVNATISAAQNADAALGEANTISTNSPHCPLKRTVAVNIRASLGDLCLRKQKSTWAPSAEALRTIMQQRKFTDLSGTTEAHGDLKSVVLHSMTLSNVSSDFDVRKFTARHKRSNQP
jgi:hypothetical protein